MFFGAGTPSVGSLATGEEVCDYPNVNRGTSTNNISSETQEIGEHRDPVPLFFGILATGNIIYGIASEQETKAFVDLFWAGPSSSRPLTV